MSNRIEQEIFKIQYAKMPIRLYLESKLGSSFIDFTLDLAGSGALLEIYLYKSKYDKTPIRKKEITTFCENEFKIFCPSLTLNIQFIFNSQQPLDHPKYYYNYLVSKSQYSPVFNTLSKMQSMILPANVAGLIIRIKGKRSARKQRKVITLGNPCRHSFSKENFIKRTYALNTSLGVVGIQIILVKKDKPSVQLKKL